jgi:hypothetical protein
VPPIRTLRGWAIAVLQDAGVIRECDDHGWMRDHAGPHARERPFAIARAPGVSAAELRKRLEPLVRKTQAFAKRVAHKGIWSSRSSLPRSSTAPSRQRGRSGTRSSAAYGKTCDAAFLPRSILFAR